MLPDGVRKPCDVQVVPEPVSVHAVPVLLFTPGAPTTIVVPFTATLCPNVSPEAPEKPTVASVITAGGPHPRQTPLVHGALDAQLWHAAPPVPHVALLDA
jgi:hypothetical protein